MPNLTETTEIVCPGGGNAPPIKINLDQILVDELRQDEIAAVTPQKAGELFASFGRAWRDLNKICNELGSALTRAEKTMNDRRSVLLVEVVPGTIKSKGLDSNKETREAIIHLDEEHRRLMDIRDEISATLEFMQGKKKSFETASHNLRKLMGEEAFNFGNRTSNPALSGGGPPRPTTTSSGFGKPRY